MAAALPNTPGEWVAFVGAGLIEGLVSPFTWVAVVLAGVMVFAAEWANSPVLRDDTRLRRSGRLDRLGWWRAVAGREEQGWRSPR
jgi:hypothetical protein